MLTERCALCHQPSSGRVREETLSFCCPGCRIVYQVLAIRGELENYQKSSLFQQAVASGLISNPALAAEKKEAVQKSRLYLQIPDLWCPSCAELIRWVLLQQKGVIEVTVDYATDLAVIDYNPCQISQEEISSKIRLLGYHPNGLEEGGKRAVHQQLFVRFSVAAFCALNLMMLSYPIYASFLEQGPSQTLFAWLSFLFILPVICYSGWPILRRGVVGLRAKLFGMEFLVSLAIVTGVFLSTWELLTGGDQVYFDSVAVVVALVLLGRWLETRAKWNMQSTVTRLQRVLPKRARKVLPDGNTLFTPIKEVKVNDQLRILSGEKVVLDGTIIEGSASIDESCLTGELFPVHKGVGDRVTSGSLLLSGSLLVRVDTIAERSFWSSLVLMAEGSLAHKGNRIRLLDRVLHWFVPIVFILALLGGFLALVETGSWQMGVVRLMAILLIACPCAIGIAVPLVEALLINQLARRGLLVRNRAILHALAKVKRWVFDKTGTLTKGELHLTTPLTLLTAEEQAVLKALVQSSTHPISQAIHRVLKVVPSPLIVEEYPGEGLLGKDAEEKVWRLGSASFLQKKDPLPPLCQGVYFELPDRIVALELVDTLRPEAEKTLKALGHHRLTLLSGDQRAVVQEVAKQCHIFDWQAECSPLSKKEQLQKWRKEGVVCMVGDGLNDAPALATASIGISFLHATDLSIQTSDLVLMQDSLSPLVGLEPLAKKAERLTRQNLFWAFAYNSIGVLLALFGFFSPLIAAIAMTISSLFIVFNSSRLIFTPSDKVLK